MKEAKLALLKRKKPFINGDSKLVTMATLTTEIKDGGGSLANLYDFGRFSLQLTRKKVGRKK